MLQNGQFNTANLHLESLNQGNYEDFKRVLSLEHNSNATTYNAGQAPNIEGNFARWSARTTSDAPYRCFIAYERNEKGEKGKVLGYVNLGTSCIYMLGKAPLTKEEGGKRLIAEGGALFFPDLPDNLVAEALNAVYISYASTALSGSNSHIAFIYTFSPQFERFNAQLGLSGLSKVDFMNPTAESALLTASLLQSEKRFKMKEGVLYEGAGEKAKNLYYYMYSQAASAAGASSLMPMVEGAGAAAASASAAVSESVKQSSQGR